jgi:hypothetical protein
MMRAIVRELEQVGIDVLTAMRKANGTMSERSRMLSLAP